MMYPYIKFEDETEVTFSQIIKKEECEAIEVHFKRRIYTRRNRKNLNFCRA